MASIPRRIGSCLASISLRICYVFSAIFATIAPQSGRDQASTVVLGLRRSLADRWATNPRQSRAIFASIAARSRPDRGSIAPRSRLDRVTIAEFFHASSGPSDEDRSLMKIRRAKAFHVASTEAVRSGSRDLHLVKMGRSRRVHVAKGGTSDHFT